MNRDNVNKILEIRDKLLKLDLSEFLKCNKELLLINDKMVNEELLSNFGIDIQEIIKELNVEILPRVQLK